MGIKEKQINHQDIEVSNSKLVVVRQDRIDCDPDRFVITHGHDEKWNVLNFSPFGVAVESTARLQERYSEVLFRIDGYPINSLSLVKVREEIQLHGLVRTAFSIQGDPLDVEAAFAIKDLNGVLGGAQKQFELDSKINKEFRLKVLEIKDFLVRLEAEINSFDKDSFQNDLFAIGHFEDRFTDRVSHFFSESLSSHYQVLKTILLEVHPSNIESHFEYFRRLVGQIMYKSAYAHRAYTKPKGYAGDFEMMNHVYKRETRGSSLFAKCLQRYFVDEPAGKAVRNRENYLRRNILSTIEKNPSKKLRILSVASGPAMEIQNLASVAALDLENIEFCLLDQDLDALKHAQRKIYEAARQNKKTVRVTLINRSIKDVIHNGLDNGKFDLIYSAGLFDYFTDPVAIFGATQLYHALNPGSKLIIGNFGLNNPNQFGMSLIMDWNLIYRSEEKMKALFGPIGKTYNLESEEQGINLFATIGS
jgi:SAM-dependent methyltransferase